MSKAAFTRGDAIAMIWGMAEASVFFIVPDVWLSYLALNGARRALIASAHATGGALMAGIGVFYFARIRPDDAFGWLDAIPGVSAPMFAHADHLLKLGLFPGMVRGSFAGIPYKIFCADAGAAGVPATHFLLASVAARSIRFVATVGVTALLSRTLFHERSMNAKTCILAAFWSTLYVAYFCKVGW